MRREPEGLRSEAGDWRVWVLIAVMVTVAMLDLVLPNVIVLAFLWVPVVASAAFAGPRVTAVLGLLGLGLALIVGAISGYYSDGTFWIRQTAMVLVSGFAVYLSYVTDDRKKRLDLMSTTDPLTGLPNRRLLIDRLDAQLRLRNRSTSAAVVFIDLDRFKAVNDTHGHRGGDLVLIEVARRFSRCIREEDTLARFGGDEFVIACPSLADAADLDALCTRLIGCLDEPIILDLQRVDVGATIGAITIAPDTKTPVDAVIHQADTKMMQMKRTESGSYTITEWQDQDPHQGAAPPVD